MEHWLPQVIVLVLLVFNLGIAVNRSGKTREVRDEFWIDFLSTCITVALLHWGGFFDRLLGR